jgi:hypothetical protein
MPRVAVRPRRAHGRDCLAAEKRARSIDEPIIDHRSATPRDRALTGALLHGDFAGVIDVLS